MSSSGKRHRESGAAGDDEVGSNQRQRAVIDLSGGGYVAASIRRDEGYARSISSQQHRLSEDEQLARRLQNEVDEALARRMQADLNAPSSSAAPPASGSGRQKGSGRAARRNQQGHGHHHSHITRAPAPGGGRRLGSLYDDEGIGHHNHNHNHNHNAAPVGFGFGAMMQMDISQLAQHVHGGISRFAGAALLRHAIPTAHVPADHRLQSLLTRDLTAEDYELLLELQERDKPRGPGAGGGASDSDINCLPVFTWVGKGGKGGKGSMVGKAEGRGGKAEGKAEGKKTVIVWDLDDGDGSAELSHAHAQPKAQPKAQTKAQPKVQPKAEAAAADDGKQQKKKEKAQEKPAKKEQPEPQKAAEKAPEKAKAPKQPTKQVLNGGLVVEGRVDVMIAI